MASARGVRKSGLKPRASPSARIKQRAALRCIGPVAGSSGTFHSVGKNQLSVMADDMTYTAKRPSNNPAAGQRSGAGPSAGDVSRQAGAT